LIFKILRIISLVLLCFLGLFEDDVRYGVRMCIFCYFRCKQARCANASKNSSGFALKQDFVEAPSQFLENWCLEYEPLKQLSRHYKTGAALPRPLFDKIKQTQLVGVGMQNLSQLVYGLIDLTFEDRYDLVKAKGAEQVEKDISALRPVLHTDGTHFIYGFGHLNGYAAQYYGYLWSKVFAQDMFTVFQKNGFMDTASGIRYRHEILKKGASVSEMDILRNFLGREPNSDAFLRSLGIGK
jgi:thimet oligopeptidase